MERENCTDNMAQCFFKNIIILLASQNQTSFIARNMGLSHVDGSLKIKKSQRYEELISKKFENISGGVDIMVLQINSHLGCLWPISKC